MVRTRFQKAKILNEAIRKSRLAARNKWEKKTKQVLVFDNGGKMVGEVMKEKDKEDEMIYFVDEHAFIESKKKTQKNEMKIVKKEVFDDDFGNDYDVFDDKKGNEKLMVDVNGYDSDDSCQIIHECYNPLLCRLNIDDVDEVEKELSDSKSSSSSEEDGDVSDKDYDDDDGDGNDDDGDGNDDDDDDNDDDDDKSSKFVERKKDPSDNIFVGNVNDGDVVFIDSDDNEEGDDDKSSKFVDRIVDNDNQREEKKKEGPFGWDWEVVKEKKQEIQPKVKRGRPPKNINVESKFVPSNIKVKKKENNNEFQNTLLNTVLDGGNEILDEMFSKKNECEIPLKFRLGGDKKVALKTEEEEEFDELFKEFDFALAACNIGIDESHMVWLLI